MEDMEPDAAMAVQVAALERRIDELRAELRARTGAARTMRQSLTCPACGVRRILHASQVLDRGDGDMAKPMAIVKPSFWRSRVLGELEAFLCTGCGLVEWYAKDVRALAESPAIDGQSLRILEADGGETGGGAGYR